MGGVFLLAGVPDWIRRGVRKSQLCTSIHVFLIPEYGSKEASPLIHLSSQLEPFSPPIPPLSWRTVPSNCKRNKTSLPHVALPGVWPWACEKEPVAQLSLSSLKEPKCGCARLKPDPNSRGILLHARVLGSIKDNPGNPQGQYALWYLTSLLMYWWVLTKQQTVAMLKKKDFIYI